ncbi:tandem-95 repeat protein, partial [Shewanella sp. 10N.286.48.B5]|uniref:tandem-95 repeat protein n=2 Tax=unclassified Shewanella TaxID=196818 RepID=UPI0039A5E46E
DNLSVDTVTYSGTDGVLTDNGDGTHSFAPNENFNGDVQLEFGVSDGTVVTPANIDIAVTDVNDAPVAGSTSYTVNEDGQITISAEQLLANSSDVDGTVSLDSVSYSGTDGILVQNQDGSVTFSPNENFNGDISLDVTIIDDDGATAETTAGITTLAVNDAPVVDGNVAYSVDEDGSITLSQEQLLANATDVDGDSLSAENLSVGDNATVVANPDGSFTITPDADFNGDLDLRFDVSDGTTTVAAGVDLTVNPVNDAAVAPDVEFTMNEDGIIIITDEQLLANASDIDGDNLSVDTVTYSGTDGVLTDNGDGTHSFAPNENFNGDVQLEFGVSDGTVVTPANIDIAVTDVNDAPVAGSTSYTVNEDGQITISAEQLLANSSDVDGTVSLDSVSYSGTDGILVQNQDGSVTFSPNENFNGDISLDVVVIDDDGATAETTAGITTLAVNDAPVVDGNVAYSVDEDGSITLSQEQLLANATDVDGDTLTAENLSVGDNATVVANPDGSFTITPDADFNGDLDLRFDVSDGTTTVAAGVDLTVNPVNDVAVAPDVEFTMNEDGIIIITDEQLLAGASDIDGDNLSVDTVTYSGTDGVLTDNGDGTHSFAPNENFNGDVQLEFGVSDGTVVTPANIDIAVTDVNDAPVAGSTSYTVNEDGQITISAEQLLANSSDVDGTVSLGSVSYSGTDGILVQNQDGSVTFSPNENFNGDISLDVVVIDDDGATAETTAGITTLAVNDAPVVDGNVAYSVDEDGSITLSQEQLLANASDIDGDSLSAENLSVGDNATVVANPDGSFTITPDADFNGDLDLRFDVSDGTTTVAAGVDLTVNPVNDAAVAPDVEFTMNEDGIIIITDEQLLAGASDIDGDNLSVDTVTYSGTDGVLTDNGDGTHSFAPNENFNGDVQLEFGVSDGTVVTPANIDIAVTDVNDAPVAGSTSYTVNEDGQITISAEQLLANSSDVDGTVSLGSVSYSGTDGILVQNQDGSVTFSPNENFNGDISLDVVVIDDDGATAETTAGITTLAVNDAPVVDGNVAYSVDEDGSITLSQEQLLANASDIDGDSLSAENLSVGDNATVVANPDGSFTITPDADFNGDVDLRFDVSDGTTTVATGVDLTVNPVNDAAVAPDVEFTMNEDGVIIITDEQLLAGASDIDGDNLSVDTVTYSGTDGVLTDNGDGTHSFAPNENFNGDVQLEFGVSDGTVVTPANIDIAVTDVNDAPVAGSTSYTVNEDGQITISAEQLLANSSDVDGTVSLDSVSYSGTDGILVQNQDGSVTFSPNENFNGEISLDVTIIDDDGATAETTAGITTLAVNDAPVVDGNIAYSVDEDGSITLSQEQLLANATDVDGDTLTAENLSVGDNATVVANPDGSFTITPDADFNGDVDLRFDVSDGTTTVATGVDLTVNPVNDAAVAPDVEFTMNEDGVIIITDEQLLAGASDIDGDNLSVDTVTYSGTDGVLTDNGDGTHSFAPNENFNGDVQLEFGVSDGTVVTPANIDIAVTDVNDAPVAGSTSYTVNEDGQITISAEQLLANSSDVDGTVSLGSVSYSGTDGILVQNQDGSVTFSPNENFNGDISLDVVVIDDDGATAETTAGITTLAVNDAPVVDGNIAYSVDEDGSITLSQEQLLANATDVDGDTLTAENLSVGDNATVVANPDGSFTITPDADFNGDLDLRFDVSDGTTTVAAGVDLTVNPVNDAAVAPDVEFTMNEDGIIIITDEQLLAGASDIDGDNLSVDTVTYSGTDGVLTDNGDGTHSFAPNENFNGDVQLEFGVSDGTVVTPANIDIAVTDVNDAPVAGSTSYTVNEDGQITISAEQLLANSSDVDGTVSLGSVSYSGTDGILVQNQDGSVTFSPNENFNGDISLDVVVIDDDGATAETTAGITTLAVNDAPVVDGNVAYSVDEDGSITLSQEQLLANASDIDGDSLSAENLSVGDNATVVANPDGSFTITPDADFNGDVDLRFDVSDGTTTVATGVDLTVNPVNDAAVAPDVEFTMNEDGVIIITDEQLLAGASDIDGDNLSVDTVTYSGTDGVLTDNGDGTHSFAPNENFNGDVQLEFGVSDGTVVTPANIDIAVTDVNDAPVAGSTSYTVNEDGQITISAEQLLANSSDVDGTVSLDSVSYSGTDGILVQNQDGSVTFSPNENFNGDISLDVVVIDDDGATAETTAGITTLAVNDAPVVDGNVAYSVDEDGSITLSQEQLLANATDVDGDTLTAENLSVGDNATVVANPDGSFTITPDADFNGDLDLRFDVSDGTTTVAAGVDLTVNPVNDAAVAPDVEFTMNEDGIIIITDEQLLANASD